MALKNHKSFFGVTGTIHIILVLNGFLFLIIGMCYAICDKYSRADSLMGEVCILFIFACCLEILASFTCTNRCFLMHDTVFNSGRF